jgi:Sigma-54 interaction domain
MPVHIFGGTGVGKELMARHVHNLTGRRGKFIALNCGAVPESLFVAELFGHERGAFTSARADGALGLARQADGGTLFLDEVSDIPLAAQTVLLRFLDRGEIRPVGGRADLRVDAQIVSAANRPLADLVQARLFREDLMFRLNAYTIELPPLRTRTDFAEIARRLLTDLTPRCPSRRRQSPRSHGDPGRETSVSCDMRSSARCCVAKAKLLTRIVSTRVHRRIQHVPVRPAARLPLTAGSARRSKRRIVLQAAMSLQPRESSGFPERRFIRICDASGPQVRLYHCA